MDYQKKYQKYKIKYLRELDKLKKMKGGFIKFYPDDSLFTIHNSEVKNVLKSTEIKLHSTQKINQIHIDPVSILDILFDYIDSDKVLMETIQNIVENKSKILLDGLKFYLKEEPVLPEIPSDQLKTFSKEIELAKQKYNEAKEFIKNLTVGAAFDHINGTELVSLEKNGEIIEFKRADNYVSCSLPDGTAELNFPYHNLFVGTQISKWKFWEQNQTVRYVTPKTPINKSNIEDFNALYKYITDIISFNGYCSRVQYGLNGRYDVVVNKLETEKETLTGLQILNYLAKGQW
jgi:hypothetical protein